MKALNTIREMPAMKKLLSLGGEIFLVGGVVRDSYMNKESKDIDIVVRLLPMENIVDTLSQFGKIEQVGESFAVLKFMPKGWEEEPIDIALPRTDIKIGAGHKGFEVQADYRLSIVEDLIRRDITINSIAISLDGEVIDPFGGLKDIENRLIKATSTKSFSDDPLRMLRCIQFASRFLFDIEEETMDMIIKHAKSIKEIPGERVMTELDKVFNKGSLYICAALLNQTELAPFIFGESINITDDFKEKAASAIEFYTLLLQQFNKPEEIYRNLLKGDNYIGKHIAALTYLKRNISDNTSDNDIRIHTAKAVRNSSDYLLDLAESKKVVGDTIVDFQLGLPKRVTELVINGNDLMARGLSGKQIGDTLNKLLLDVLCKRLPNESESLFNAL